MLAAYPDLAEPLRAYLDRLDELHEAASGFARSDSRAEEVAAPTDEERRLGDFRLLREIGRGGMGVVYEAQQISLGRRVALKVLPFAAVLDSRQIARFKHEAQAAAQLDHPNIVSVFAVGIDRGVHYYAMQFIDGQPLDRALAELRGKSSPGLMEKHAESASVLPRSTGSLPVSHGQDGRATKEFAALPSNAANLSTIDYCPTTPGSLLTARSGNQHDYCRTVVRLGIQAAEALHAGA